MHNILLFRVMKYAPCIPARGVTNIHRSLFFRNLCKSGFNSAHGNGAFQPLPLHIAAQLVGLFHITVGIEVRRRTAAAAIEPSPAILTVLPGVDVEARRAS